MLSLLSLLHEYILFAIPSVAQKADLTGRRISIVINPVYAAYSFVSGKFVLNITCGVIGVFIGIVQGADTEC
jgi:hypothetical protein